jgi:hypothetical protein
MFFLLAVVLSGSRLGQEEMEMQGGAGMATACLQAAPFGHWLNG